MRRPAARTRPAGAPYAGLGVFSGRIANVYGNYLHVEYLDRLSAEKAIREPLEIYNSQLGVSEPVKIQDELVEAVLDQVRAYDSNGEPGPAGQRSLTAAPSGFDAAAATGDGDGLAARTRRRLA